MNKKFFSILLVITLIFSSVSVFADNSSLPQVVVVPEDEGIVLRAIVVPDDGGELTAPKGGTWELIETTSDDLFKVYEQIEYYPANIVALKMGEVMSSADKSLVLGYFQSGAVSATEVIFKKYFSASTVTGTIMPYFGSLLFVYSAGQDLLGIAFRSQLTQAASQLKGVIVEYGYYGPSSGIYEGTSFESAKVWSGYPDLNTPLYHIGSFTHYNY